MVKTRRREKREDEQGRWTGGYKRRRSDQDKGTHRNSLKYTRAGTQVGKIRVITKGAEHRWTDSGREGKSGGNYTGSSEQNIHTGVTSKYEQEIDKRKTNLTEPDTMRFIIIIINNISSLLSSGHCYPPPMHIVVQFDGSWNILWHLSASCLCSLSISLCTVIWLYFFWPISSQLLVACKN